METKPIETYTVHEYLRSKLCSLYENDCIFDKFECCWNGTDSAIMTGSYNNFFRSVSLSVNQSQLSLPNISSFSGCLTETRGRR